jgi:serine/threonine-protein kinase
VAIGLQHVHEAGLIHRDIKPSNIMVTGDSFERRPRVRILDLGLGRAVGQLEKGDDLTRDGHTVGTLDYMSPEQLQDNRLVDIRSDIYALGCTLFEALTGRQPFEGGDVSEKLLAKMAGVPVAIESLRDDVPADLRTLILQMLSQAPERRPATPHDVAESLREFQLREHLKSRLQAEASPSTVVARQLAKASSRSNRLDARVARTVRILAYRFVHRFAPVRFAHLRSVRASE